MTTTAALAAPRVAVPGRDATPAVLPGFLRRGRSQVVDDHDRALWDALEGVTAGGKRFRPALLLQLHRALGGSDEAAAAAVAGAVELLHTAFVIHDDVIDGDHVRRGRPNVGGVFAARALDQGVERGRAHAYGDAAGILAGDLALAGAVREVALCGAPREVVARLLDLLEEVLHLSAAGELADVRVSLTSGSTLADALDIAGWKTAAYSFELPMQAAAILARAPAHVVGSLGAVGRCLGVTFQLQDDLAGVFGTAEQTGKDPLCDLREGKATALVAVARSTRRWEELSRYVGDPDLTAEDARRARELLVACGARRAVQTLVRELREAAVHGTEALPTPVRQTLLPMIDQLVLCPGTGVAAGAA